MRKPFFLSTLCLALALCGCSKKNTYDFDASGAGQVTVYVEHGVWVFDAPDQNVTEGEFGGGALKAFDSLTEGITSPKKGFTLHYSTDALDGQTHQFVFQESDPSGFWYSLEPGGETMVLTGFLDLFKAAPETINLKAEAK